MKNEETVVAKVNFELVSTEPTASDIFYFKTRHKNLYKGQKVWVVSRGKEMVANFLGYAEEEYEAKSVLVRPLAVREYKKYHQQLEAKLIKYPLKISIEALEDYRSLFRNNSDVTEEQARLKLTRNVLLSNSNKLREDNGIDFKYGNQIIKVKNHTVIDVKQLEEAGRFKKDIKKYLELNEKLGIAHY